MLKYSLLTVAFVFVLPVLAHAVLWLSEERPRSWRDADWSSAGTLPDPREDPEASIRVMAARTGMTIGEVSGTMEPTRNTTFSGSVSPENIMKKPIMSGSSGMKDSCCASWSVVATAPTAANSAE